MADNGMSENNPYPPPPSTGPTIRKKRDVPDGLWMRCTGCEGMLYRKRIAENLEVCPECDHHYFTNKTDDFNRENNFFVEQF